MPEKRAISFGRYLRAARQERAIDLKRVSSQTRIGIDTLQAIEDENHGRLPAEVFVKGFLRAYARVVGADGDEAVRRYIQSRQMLEATVRAETDRIRVSRRFWPRLLAIGGGFAGIILLAVALVPAPGPRSHPAAVEPGGEPAVEAPAPAVSEGVQAPPQGAAGHQTAAGTEPGPVPAAKAETAEISTELPPTAQQRHLLAITATEETWMKVIVDNLDSREYTLRPGDRLELDARDGFNLLVGNAGGIQVVLDGQSVPVPGKSGQVVNLQLP